MAILVWFWSKEIGSGYQCKSDQLRGALTLATDDIRSQVAWQYEGYMRGSLGSEDASAKKAWPTVGKAFFKEVWPLEPILQTARTAERFAGVPANTGVLHFPEAVGTVMPFLRPFDVWSSDTTFWLGAGDSDRQEIIAQHPEATLRLLSASIDLMQGHTVLDLGRDLDQIVSANPILQSDSRVRALRKLS